MPTPDRHLLLVSCGTSLLTHEADPRLRDLMREHADARQPDDFPTDAHEALERHRDRVAAFLADADDRECRRRSAELSTLLAWQGEKQHRLRASDHVLLVHTDTVLGRWAAELIAAWLEQRRIPAELRTRTGLSLRDRAELDLALADLAKSLSDEMPGWRARAYGVTWALTGGYKALQGFLQSLGSIQADEVVYIFETGDALVRVPRLPLAFAADAQLAAHLAVVRRLASGLPVAAADRPDLPETLLLEIGGSLLLSSWGYAAWAALRDEIDARALGQPISPRLRLAPRLAADFAALPPARRIQLNRQLDKLAICVERGLNPSSLDLKKLEGQPVQGSTHEADAWSDGDARRLFCHLEGEVLVVDRLGPHL